MPIESIKNAVRNLLPGTANLRQKLAAKTWPEKSIACYVGNKPMVLESDLRSKGASGSEASIIFLTQEWVKRGYQVTVYTNTNGKDGVYNGVTYRHFRQLNWYDRFDTLLIARNPGLLNPVARARRIWLEWQDVVYPPKSFTPEKLSKFDKIFAKSHYQRHLLPEVPDEKFAIIPNGVSPWVLELGDREKNPYKLVYASRYYRGLESMLRYGWPLIKQEIPQAELHLFYGFTKRDDRQAQLPWKEAMMKLIADTGAIDRGKVGYEELMAEKATAAIHYYGCTYEEVDCISVRESSLVGCVPVTTDFAVLGEKNYCVTIPGEAADPKTQEAIARKIIHLLQHPDELATIRQKTQELAKHETWDNLAPLWLEHIQS
ncbi:hypothetical protein [Roseofilum casamattae]|uniref:Glycosyltransferase family 1 protein n=1 Tax=Roseofilum casamattae BLCC-M143 TaxID=3022442 RepID=A0ABT7C1K4_9CYAN|nr:hypothetical protein [Roseofilum casamattae]MDJ1185324.1 glycosyltransferase family 1 protein [Roseofilum casamattae BLCC-M143]